MIETYYHAEEGYNPFLIREGWQVAQLNYQPQNSLDNIDMVEVHKVTDEVFILFKGQAVLIAADTVQENITFECVNMKVGVTYNIPAGRWHNIAMSPDTEMIIVEKSNTHKTDCSYLYLEDNDRQRLLNMIQQCSEKEL